MLFWSAAKIACVTSFVQEREIQRNSTAVNAPSADWQYLSIVFTSPSFASYADLRFVALGDGTVYVDDVWFGQTALAPGQEVSS